MAEEKEQAELDKDKLARQSSTTTRGNSSFLFHTTQHIPGNHLSSPLPMNQSALTIADIRLVSKVTTDLLSAAGLSCCLVGSSAGFEHGITRTPNVQVSKSSKNTPYLQTLPSRMSMSSS